MRVLQQSPKIRVGRGNISAGIAMKPQNSN
jgi:hypothetical protein